MVEREVLRRLRQEEFDFPPADLRLLSRGGQTATSDGGGDGLLEVTWGQHSAIFLFEAKDVSTPRMIDEAVKRLVVASMPLGVRPLLICPYLSNDRLRELERRGVSGIDLNGNGVIITADMRLWTTGNPSAYKPRGIKRNPYRGDSSVFTRALLLQPEFESQRQLRDTVIRNLGLRGGQEVVGLTLPTVSRVIDALAEDIIVSKDKRSIKLIDRVRLLENLKKNYRASEGDRILGRTAQSAPEIWAELSRQQASGGSRFAATGIASAGFYKVLSGVTVLSLYLSDLGDASERLAIKPGRAFANIELIEEPSPTFYFDATIDREAVWSSPLQCWLELTNSGPREQEAAQSIFGSLRRGPPSDPEAETR